MGTSPEREIPQLVAGLQEAVSEYLNEIPPTRDRYEEWERRFGDKVRQWRRARNWSQDDLVERLRDHGFEMHQTTVAKIERGTRPLRVAEAMALASILGVPPLAVFHGPGPEDQPESMEFLQRKMDAAEEALKRAREILDTTSSMYALTLAEVKRVTTAMNDAALEAERKRGDESEA
jgi:transcriptional regulator with XRE-family HTH domain